MQSLKQGKSMRGFLRHAPPLCCSLNLAIHAKHFGHFFIRSLRKLNPQAPLVIRGFSEMILPLLGVNTLAKTLLALEIWSFHVAFANS